MIINACDVTTHKKQTLTIYVPNHNFKNGQQYCLSFKLTPPMLANFAESTGVEKVYISGGNASGSPCFDKHGNIFYSDMLKNGFCYRVVFGNNGSDNTRHFTILSAPNCPRKYNPNGNTVAENENKDTPS